MLDERVLADRGCQFPAVSIMGISLMVLLFVNELNFYMTPYLENEVSLLISP